MTVHVSTKRFDTIRRRGGSDTRHVAEHSPPVPSPNTEHRTREQRPRQARPSDSRAPAERRLTNDRAFYNCQCGYVFQAPVSTSVGCPHCGGTQAW